MCIYPVSWLRPGFEGSRDNHDNTATWKRVHTKQLTCLAADMSHRGGPELGNVYVCWLAEQSHTQRWPESYIPCKLTSPDHNMSPVGVDWFQRAFRITCFILYLSLSLPTVRVTSTDPPDTTDPRQLGPDVPAPWHANLHVPPCPRQLR